MPPAPGREPLPLLEPAWPDVRRETWGPYAVDVTGTGYRNLAVDGVVLVADLYAAVRLPDWSTVPVEVVSVGARERAGSWVVTSTAEAAGRFRSVTSLELRPDRVLAVRHELTPLTDLPVNRWGLNVCLAAAAWSGAAVTLAGESYVLPDAVAPQRLVDGRPSGLFPASATVELARANGDRLRITSAGPLLELEDQRNWTDPTYKLYSGSLADVRPFSLHAGQTYRQVLELGVRLRGGTRPAERTVIGPVRPLPRLGVQANGAATAPDLTAVLTDLGVEHVRVDAERSTAERVLDALPSMAVELAVLAGDDLTLPAAHAAALAARVRGPVRVLWHRDRRRTTTAADADATGLGTDDGRVTVVPGTDAYVVDLNRDRPEVGPAVSFSVVPTVHTRDSQTVFASLATQAAVVGQARRLFAAEVDVSPVTWTLRGDPEGRHDAGRRATGSPLDPRAGTLEGAAWTLGSVHALLCGEARSGTWHELVGDGGLLGPDGSVRPAFHALAALATGSADRPPTRAIGTPGAAWIGLQLVDVGRLVLVSLRPWPQVLDIGVLDEPPTVRRRLVEEDVVAAARTRRWWDTAPTTPLAAPAAVALEAFEISVLDGRR